MTTRTQQLKAETALLAVGFIWGATFPVVKMALESTSPLWFNGIRFVLAGFIALGLLIPDIVKRQVSMLLLLRGAFLGILLAVSYSAQTIGLAFTTSAKAGFITGLFVVFVPVFGALMFQRAPSGRSMFAVTLATAGLGMLTLNERFGIARGDLIVLICAVVFAFHILFLDRFTKEHPSRQLAMTQLVTAGLLMGVVAWIIEPAWPSPAPVSWMAIGVTAVFATIGAFFIQTWAQRRIGPTRTALILTSEPVFAGVFGYLLLSEIFGLRQVIGAAFILGAMIVAETGGLVRQSKPTGYDTK